MRESSSFRTAASIQVASICTLFTVALILQPDPVSTAVSFDIVPSSSICSLILSSILYSVNRYYSVAPAAIFNSFSKSIASFSFGCTSYSYSSS